MDDKLNDARKYLSIKEAKEKIYNFCTYQERTQKEVRFKLFEYGLSSDEIEGIIADLITDNFINEERFAKTYAGGKFRIKKWGRMKIYAALKFRGISEYCMREAISSIDEEDYHDSLSKLLEKRSSVEKEKNTF